MKPCRLLTLILTALGWLGGLASAADPTAETLAVRVIQFRSTSDLDDNLSRIIQHIRQASTDGMRVIVFPECALPGYDIDWINAISDPELRAAEREIATTCRESNMYAIVGTVTREADLIYNTAVVFTPKGTELERYHKIQLVENWAAPGERLSVFPIDGVLCSIIICHDERYPELVRLPVLAGSRVVFYLSNESGLRFQSKLEPYRAQIVARAVENGVFVVHANAPANLDLTDRSASHGQSRIIAPDGNLLVPEASYLDEDVLSAILPLKQATARNAMKSIQRGPLQDWWRQGIQQVQRSATPGDGS